MGTTQCRRQKVCVVSKVQPKEHIRTIYAHSHEININRENAKTKVSTIAKPHTTPHHNNETSKRFHVCR